MAQSHLEIRREDRVLFLTLNRPEKRNALSLQLAHELVRALDAADGDPSIGAILVTGNGKAFCAGMDLSEIGQVETEDLDDIHNALFSSGTRITKPIVAAVTGAAVAGGTGLVANAHVVVASPDSTFGLTEIRIGLWPLLVFRSVSLAIGERRAVELSLTGRIVPAAEAREMALVHEISDSPVERATEIARRISQFSMFIMKNGLDFVNQSRGCTWTEAGRMARLTRDVMMRSPDFAEGLAAFRQKREARWNTTTP